MQPLITSHANKHSASDLIGLFNDVFSSDYRTFLVGNAEEPLYQPHDQNRVAHIYFRSDYFSSALHEVAHWCIAGEERRQQLDYGYWYLADNREPSQQQAFFDAEVKPQALEWLFSVCCGYPFSVSLDNVNACAEIADWSYWETMQEQKQRFTERCYQQLTHWFITEFPERAVRFSAQLSSYYRPDHSVTLADFS